MWQQCYVSQYRWILRLCMWQRLHWGRTDLSRYMVFFKFSASCTATIVVLRFNIGREVFSPLTVACQYLFLFIKTQFSIFPGCCCCEWLSHDVALFSSATIIRKTGISRTLIIFLLLTFQSAPYSRIVYPEKLFKETFHNSWYFLTFSFLQNWMSVHSGLTTVIQTPSAPTHEVRLPAPVTEIPITMATGKHAPSTVSLISIFRFTKLTILDHGQVYVRLNMHLRRKTKCYFQQKGCHERKILNFISWST